MFARAISIGFMAVCCGAFPGPVVGQAHSRTSLEKPSVLISGEISATQTFEKEIGHGLVFRLVPSPDGFGKGWDIEVVPKQVPEGGYAEYSAIVTPPYHFYNLRYVNASYGITAQEAVGISPRSFQFVETKEEMDAASTVVNSVIYSVDWTAHKDSTAASAEKIPVGQGEFKILKSRITKGKNQEDLGAIDWIRFQVTLRFHSTNLKEVLFPNP